MRVQDGSSAAEPVIAIPGIRDDDPQNPRRCIAMLIYAHMCVCDIPASPIVRASRYITTSGFASALPILQSALLSASAAPLP